ncbi:2-amino-4-hydroxy-6-hydroxymethyldihydropteridine diphosphokinase [Roseinatronobacter sp. NSM]|uniref:2-amino-4-hydroxy-6- hydroxymethyldihydropteridine diphosphokinase n=1 Tax=Roseinatronobacter sp. NSM TaxID=3457785 RepID=UPI0040369FD8
MLDSLIGSKCNPILIALGSNLAGHSDSPIVQLDKAIREIARKSVTIMERSPYYRTPCFPAGAGPDFVNAAIVCECDLAPRALLDVLHGIEQAAGRERTGRWSARVLDLDLLAMGGAILPDVGTFRYWSELAPAQQMQQTPPELILPHPRLQDRAFVLQPLLDIAPDWVHPDTGLSVRDMHAALDRRELAQIVRVSG